MSSDTISKTAKNTIDSPPSEKVLVSSEPERKRAPKISVCDSSGACAPAGVPREFLPQGFIREPEGLNFDPAQTGPSSLTATVGTVGNVTVTYDTSLGASGLILAQQFLAVAHRPYIDMNTFFGINGGPVTVVISALGGKTDGSAGAYHYGCDFTSGGTLY